jgi:hypothetical protein
MSDKPERKEKEKRKAYEKPKSTATIYKIVGAQETHDVESGLKIIYD